MEGGCSCSVQEWKEIHWLRLSVRWMLQKLTIRKRVTSIFELSSGKTTQRESTWRYIQDFLSCFCLKGKPLIKNTKGWVISVFLKYFAMHFLGLLSLENMTQKFVTLTKNWLNNELTTNTCPRIIMKKAGSGRVLKDWVFSTSIFPEKKKQGTDFLHLSYTTTQLIEYIICSTPNLLCN